MKVDKAVEQTEHNTQSSYEAAFASWDYDGYSIYQVGAGLGGEAFLLRTAQGATALFDTGFPFCAEKTLERIYAVTQGAPLDAIVLTHSHYDHCGAASYLVEHMPDAKVYASAYAAYVFTRPGAYKTMRTLNDNRAQTTGVEGTYPTIDKEVHVDVVLEDGDVFSIGEMEFKAIAAVGHTKCCMAFWCESAGLFISSETSGVVCPHIPSSVDVPEDVHYMIDLIELVGFNSALEHIEHIRTLPIRTFVATHYGCLSGTEVADMWRAVDFWRDYIVNLVTGMHKDGAKIDAITSVYKDTFYWGGTSPYQPEAAFDLNVSFALPTIIRDCLGEEPHA